METLATEGMGSLTILAIALAIWLLTGKATRKSVGNSLQAVVGNVEQSLTTAQLLSAKETKEELGDLDDAIASAIAIKEAGQKLRG